MPTGNLLGIDVSHYQGDVDWFAVAQSAVAFAFAKASEGSTVVDSTFRRNWAEMREHGLFRGAYHFARPGGDPEIQAAHFASVVGPLGFRDLPPVLDLEESDGHPPAHVLAWAAAFVTRAEALFQRELLIYTGGFWRFQLGNPDQPFFSRRKLWLAAYTANPVVPRSWARWAFWQFSDGIHNTPFSVRGVRGPVDQNRFDGDESLLEALCTPAAPAEAPSAPVSTPTPVGAPAWPGVPFIWPATPPVVSQHVRLWQSRVAALGFPLDVDGVYGPQSKAACRAFQRDHGLKADGIVGPRTWQAAFAEPG